MWSHDLAYASFGPGRHTLEINTIQDIGKEADLVHRHGVALGLIVFEDKDILPVRDILQIEINGLAELVLFAICPIAEFGVEPEIIGEPVRKIMQRVVDLIPGFERSGNIHRRSITPTNGGHAGIERKSIRAGVTDTPLPAGKYVEHIFVVESGVAFDAVAAFVTRIEE